MLRLIFVVILTPPRSSVEDDGLAKFGQLEALASSRSIGRSGDYFSSDFRCDGVV